MPGPLRPTSVRPSFAGDEREFLLQVIQEQTQSLESSLGAKIDALALDSNSRLLTLERARLEDDRMRLDVRELTTEVRKLNESDRVQNTSLVALTAALKPSVEATASIEGQAAGKAAGGRAGKLWGIVGSVLALVLAGAVQQCQQQIARGAFDPAPASSK